MIAGKFFSNQSRIWLAEMLFIDGQKNLCISSFFFILLKSLFNTSATFLGVCPLLMDILKYLLLISHSILSGVTLVLSR